MQPRARKTRLREPLRNFAAGMDAYVTKPFTQDQLVEVLTRWATASDKRRTTPGDADREADRSTG